MRADLRVDEVERAGEQRARAWCRRRGSRRLQRRPTSGSFCAVETDWKFMPKSAGVADLRRAAVVVAVDLVEDRLHLVAVVLLGRALSFVQSVGAGRQAGRRRAVDLRREEVVDARRRTGPLRIS